MSSLIIVIAQILNRLYLIPKLYIIMLNINSTAVLIFIILKIIMSILILKYYNSSAILYVTVLLYPLTYAVCRFYIVADNNMITKYVAKKRFEDN